MHARFREEAEKVSGSQDAGTNFFSSSVLLQAQQCALWLFEATQPKDFRAMRKNVLSITEFGQMYGLGKTRTYEEINSGRLPAIKVGRRTLIRISDAEAWFKACPAFVIVANPKSREFHKTEVMLA
jgi:excisionase family DNA binding protein